MLPADVCRCEGRRSIIGKRCPLRLECARYVQRFDDAVPRFLVAAWLCDDDTFSQRIPTKEHDGNA
jgi:hypothetical protein